MDDNISWKVVYLGAFFSLLVLGFAYWLISPRDSSYLIGNKSEKLAEFNRTHIEGRKEGKKIWEFNAGKGWTNKNQDITFLSDVKRGIIYQDGKPIVFGLSSPLLTVNRDSNVIEMRNKVQAFLGKNSPIKADSAQYLQLNNQINLSGNVLIKLREKNIATKVKCGQATVSNDQKQEISLNGSIEVTQVKNRAFAPNGVYSLKNKSLRLTGGTKTSIDKAKAVVTANEIIFSTLTGDARAAGSVEVIQKGQKAKSDAAVYDNKKELLTFTGNVYFKKGEDWISCRQVVISIKKDSFEASGVSEAKFKL